MDGVRGPSRALPATHRASSSFSQPLSLNLSSGVVCGKALSNGLARERLRERAGEKDWRHWSRIVLVPRNRSRSLRSGWLRNDFRILENDNENDYEERVRARARLG